MTLNAKEIFYILLILPILLSDRYFGDQQITFAEDVILRNHSNFCTLTQPGCCSI